MLIYVFVIYPPTEPNEPLLIHLDEMKNICLFTQIDPNYYGLEDLAVFWSHIFENQLQKKIKSYSIFKSMEKTLQMVPNNKNKIISRILLLEHKELALASVLPANIGFK